MQQTSQRLRATSAQYGIWVAQQVDPDDPGYLTAEAVELDGPLDQQAFEAAVCEVLDRADALQMRFEWTDDRLWQHRQPARTQVPLLDFSADTDPEQAARAWMQASLSVCCDVTSDPLYRTALLRISPQCHWWYLQVHHIALDGFGYSLIQQTVASRYNARTAGAPLPALPDWRIERVVDAEAEYRRTGKFERDQAFWRDHLRDVPAPLQLAPKQPFGPTSIRHTLRLDAARSGALRTAAEAAGADWSAWMLSALGLWLGKQAGQRDLTIGLPVMNRLGTPALGVPCMAMNIVPLRLHVRPDATLQALTVETAGRLRAMRPHLYYRYGWIRGDLGLLESNKFLFNQAINLMPFDRQVTFDGLDSRMQSVSGGPVKDLNVTLVVRSGEWHLTLEANPNAYDVARLTGLAGSLSDWLSVLAAHPPGAPLASLLNDLPPLSVCAGAPLAGPVVDVLALLARAAEQAPDRIAIETPDERIDYRALMARVEAMAAALTQRGVDDRSRIAILAPRSPDAIAAMLAVLRVGAAFLPLDPDGPAQRAASMLADAAPNWVMTREPWRRHAGAWPVLDLDGVGAAAHPACCDAPAAVHPAYLLYTSGSTGRPNGVLVGRGALAHFVASTRALYRVGPADRVLQFAPLHFDASLEEIFVSLCHGATLVLRDDAMLDSVATFAAEVERLGVTVLDLPTAYWQVLAHALDPEAARRLARVRLTIIGGEAALPERVARWRELMPAQVLLNTYGPTEATIIATTARLAGPQAVWAPGEAVPIGVPRPGIAACIVDERLYPVAAGVVGELVLSGPALALQYLNNPDLTAARFVRLPDSGERAYRTGDLAQLQNGQLRFLGRIDHQVKISGLRIEPLEIENLLLGMPAVREAAVVPVPRGPGLHTLTAFVAGTDDVQALRARLADALPAAAIPDAWQVLEQLPRNPNGKTDRKALLQRAELREAAADGDDAGPLERQVMHVWRQVLGDLPMTPASNFFDLGGKSLQAIQTAGQLAVELQRDVPVSMLFRHATVQALAGALTAPLAYRPQTLGDAFAPMLPIQSGRPGAPALICVHPADGLAWGYLRLARHLPETTVYGLQMSVDETRDAQDFDALVERYTQRVRALQADGPYYLLGWSLGGALAHGIAARLAAQGHAIGLLALMDSYPAAAWGARAQPMLRDALQILLTVNGDFDTADLPDDALRQRLLRATSPFAVLGPAGLDAFAGQTLRQMQMFRASETPAYDGELLLFRASRNPDHVPVPDSWLPHVGQSRLHCSVLDCSHDGMSDPAPMAAIGAVLAARLA
ncbi:amino acid adenylation domain-containing protein [Burkholderia alba]|uniref:amino acid adenylation domain-containing protein n=1 Tax=Burkholderia alba TaxID=2683677 RepID=UPI002B059462|nr:amino acid adenylation domain-containing protein [Burkholderia alba]